jgi:hypothetical protein
MYHGDGASRVFQNISVILVVCTASHPRKPAVFIVIVVRTSINRLHSNSFLSFGDEM